MSNNIPLIYIDVITYPYQNPDARLDNLSRKGQMPTKWEKSTDRDQILISSESGQDILACQKLQAIPPMRSPENTRKPSFWPVEMPPKLVKSTTTKI